MGGQQFAEGSDLLDTAELARVTAFDGDRGLVEVEAGIRWPALHDWLEHAQAGRPARGPSGKSRPAPTA